MYKMHLNAFYTRPLNAIEFVFRNKMDLKYPS